MLAKVPKTRHGVEKFTLFYVNLVHLANYSLASIDYKKIDEKEATLRFKYLSQKYEFHLETNDNFLYDRGTNLYLAKPYYQNDVKKILYDKKPFVSLSVISNLKLKFFTFNGLLEPYLLINY